MKIYYDKYEQPEQLQVHLATPSKKPICTLNGINPHSFNFDNCLKTISEITFEVDRFIEIDGKEVESNGYALLNKLMRIKVDNIGWFIMNSPDVSNDGFREIKTISALSAESEMQQHDLHSFKINCGTPDSYEMLVEGNVEMIGDTPFAKENIKFYNSENPELSLLDIALKESGLYGWEIGYIDTTPKTYREYVDGKLVERKVALPDEVGTFDFDAQDLYSFYTQTVAQFFSCVFVFDYDHFKINVYRPENLGKDTNINIGFRNLEKTNDITVNENNLYTRISVSGSDDLGIESVNMGLPYLENIDYFLNEKYLPKDTIEKYKLWKDDFEENRPIYIENTRLYNQQQKIITELYNRLPLDDCSTNWQQFSDEKLLAAQANYQAQLKGYETFYVDSDNHFDELALRNSFDYDSYIQIKDVILPSIQIEINNRKLPPKSDPEKYIESFKTDWKLYGLDELEVKLQTYRNNKKLAEDANCTIPFNVETSEQTEEYHTKLYNLYLDAINQLNPDFVGGCQEAYDKRKAEIDSAKELQNQHKAKMQECVSNTDKKNWKHIDSENPEKIYSFTEKDLAALSKLYIDGDYENNNIFLVNSDDAISSIDEQLKLLDAAEKDLSSTSQPQFIYKTSLENFLSKYEYKNYTDNLNLGDFIYLGVRDDRVVKLRIIALNYNPLVMDNDLTISFSNMIRGTGELDDFVDLLNAGTSISKHVGSSHANDYKSNQGIGLTPELIQKLVSSGSFVNQLQQVMGNLVLGNGGGSLSLNELNSKMIKVVDLFADNGFFEYLQSKLISTDKIVATSGNFKELSSLVGRIDTLLSGNVSAELGQLIKLTSQNVHIDEAVIRDMIAAQITVSMLQASTISADKFTIKSDDGGLEVKGNTMQFRDARGNIRIQIGRDSHNEFTFVLYDSSGKGVLIDSNGIKSSAISDGLIKTNMIADGAITEDKIDKTNIREWKDADGNKVFDVSKFYYGNDKFEVSYTQTAKQAKDAFDKIGNLESKLYNIELSGEQIFKKLGDVITPASITVTARGINGATIGKWYIDGIENTEFVSPDNRSITIPGTFMCPKNGKKKHTATIKVEDSTGKLFDLHTLYFLDDIAVSEGQSAITVVISSNKGTVFSENTDITETIFSCTVYEGQKEISPLSYEWQIVSGNNDDWVTVGHESKLSMKIDPTIPRKRVRCLVDVERTKAVYLYDTDGNIMEDNDGNKIYTTLPESEIPENGNKDITTVNTKTTLNSDDSVFVNEHGLLKQVSYDSLANAVLDKIRTKTYKELENKNIIAAIIEASGVEITSQEVKDAFMSIINKEV